jgi:hypothetical protein
MGDRKPRIGLFGKWLQEEYAVCPPEIFQPVKIFFLTL